MTDHVLTLNAGSATIKFALFKQGFPIQRLLDGTVDGIGSSLRFSADQPGEHAGIKPAGLAPATHGNAMAMILDFLDQTYDGKLSIAAVGHRIVHGGLEFTAPQRLDSDVLAALAKLRPFAPIHQVHNLAGVEAAAAAFPDALQYGCFDTAFHRTHPWVSDAFALPRSYYDEGVRRYGFHGLSYEYIQSALKERSADCANGRVVVAHLGNGASLCAMKGGQSVASTMGFSPLDGLPMGTRCGQIDPGVLLYMLQQQHMDADQIQRLLYNESGLKGLSGISNDMRVLQQSDSQEATRAIDYFIHHICRQLASMVSTINGLDTLVFTGGIGENAKDIRKRICQDMQWLGIKLDEAQNEKAATRISDDNSQVEVLIIPTDEEATIARHAVDFV